jgi:hypothetical protein
MNTLIHPVTGLSAIGWRKARRGENGPQPIWPVLGGSEETDEAEAAAAATAAAEAAAAATEGEGDDDPDGAEQLGDAGKRALDAMKAQLKAEKERRKAAETELTGFKAKPAEPTDSEALRAEALATARAETLRDRAMDRLEAKAARLFADPEDARALLAGRVEDFVDGNGIDADAITEALTDLLARKPHLAAAQQQTKPTFAGTGDGGARKGPDGVKQLGKADLKTMSAEEIVAAQNKGQFRDFLATE